jgi:hypothetical protein
MFPNGRLVLVAMVASVVAVSCGLGVFAAFRVNHQPFTRMQSADPPLQLVFGNGAPAPVKDVSAAPFGIRFLMNVPVAVPETAAAVSIQQMAATPPDTAVPAADSDPAAPPPPAATIETPAPVAAASSDQEAPQQASQPAPKEVTKEVESPAEQAAKPDSTSDDVALTSPPDQTSTIVPAGDAASSPDDARPAQNKKKVAPSVKPTVKAAAKRRVVRHFRRIQPADAAQSPAQTFGIAPAYQAFPDTTVPPVVRRRVVVKRHRPADKAAAQAPAGNQAAGSGPVLATSKR